jgi:hypothetical protein
MMKKLLIVALITLCIQTVHAEENLYEKNYRPQNSGGLQSLQQHPDTKMYVSNHFDDDNISMLEDGYDMMGSSGFEAGSIMPDQALIHAKSIKQEGIFICKSEPMELYSMEPTQKALHSSILDNPLPPALIAVTMPLTFASCATSILRSLQSPLSLLQVPLY